MTVPTFVLARTFARARARLFDLRLRALRDAADVRDQPRGQADACAAQLAFVVLAFERGDERRVRARLQVRAPGRERRRKAGRAARPIVKLSNGVASGPDLRSDDGSSALVVV